MYVYISKIIVKEKFIQNKLKVCKPKVRLKVFILHIFRLLKDLNDKNSFLRNIKGGRARRDRDG